MVYFYAQKRRLPTCSQESRSEGAVIRTTEFHPSSTVGLVAGLNGTASLFQLDGKSNPKIQTVNFENFPIKCARFSADGREFLAGSQHHPHLYVYDMMAGKIAKVRWNRNLEAGTATNSQAFEMSPDGQLMAVRGRAGVVHLLSARSEVPPLHQIFLTFSHWIFFLTSLRIVTYNDLKSAR